MSGESFQRGDRVLMVVRFGTTSAISLIPPMLQVEHLKMVGTPYVLFVTPTFHSPPTSHPQTCRLKPQNH